jgi:hypothetical protein
VCLGYGTYIWLSVSNYPLKCAVVSLNSVVKQRLKCNTGEVCNCLIQFLLTMVNKKFTDRNEASYRPLFIIKQKLRNVNNTVHICDRSTNNAVNNFNTVCSESRCALRLRYVYLVVSIEVAVEVCCCFTVFSC